MTWARRGNKFNARKVEIDGIRFDSQKEARRYQELVLLQKAGEIKWFDCHPRLPLFGSASSTLCAHTGLVWEGPEGGLFDPYAVRIGHYSPDFHIIYTNGEVVVEDVKSEPSKTTAYRLRKKIFEANYWPLTVTEV